MTMKSDPTRFEIKKSAILDATHRCIFAEGVANTSMRSIAKAANVSQSVLHYYFKNKEDLLIEYSRKLVDWFVYDIERRYNQSDPPQKKLDAVFEAAKTFCGERRDLFVAFVDTWELAIRNPLMKESFTILYERLTKLRRYL